MKTTLVKAEIDKFGQPNKTGIKVADWLNGLGPDEKHYTATHTVGKVRRKYIKNRKFTHIIKDE